MKNPTPRADWVEEGDRCLSMANKVGTVVKVLAGGRRVTSSPLETGSLPRVVVKWDDSGSIGHHTITTLRRAP